MFVNKCGMMDSSCFRCAFVERIDVRYGDFIPSKLGPVTSHPLKICLFFTGFHAITRHAIYILGRKVDLKKNVTFPDFGREVHLIAVF